MGAYGSLVVAFEHSARIVMKPSRNTILSQGDRVWVFADQVMAEPLLALLGDEGEVAVVGSPAAA